MDSATPANELTASVVFMACAWASPLGIVVGFWFGYIFVRRLLDRGLAAMGCGGGR